MRLRPPVQLFQPLSHLKSILFTSIENFTIWTVDSQQGQQAASQTHDKPRGYNLFTSGHADPQVAGTVVRKGVTDYGIRQGCRFTKFGLTSRSVTSLNGPTVSRSFSQLRRQLRTNPHGSHH